MAILKSILFLFLVGATALAADAVFGPNLAANADFEGWREGKPVDWIVNPAGSASIGVDSDFHVSGASSLRLSIPAAGSVNLSSKAIPVEPGAKYMFSLAYRSEGFGVKGKYSGVDSSARLIWMDAVGKQVGAGGTLALPYHAVVDWDLRDTIATAPSNAASAIVSFGFGNHSGTQTGTNISSALWLDAFRLLRYFPPADPEAAKRKVEKIVEGGWDNSLVKSYNLSSLRYGKFAEIVNDPAATDGTCLRALTSEGRGLIAHSPAFSSPAPGLYRAVIRAKAARVGTGRLGSLDVSSENSAARGSLDLNAADFAAPNVYQDVSVDFILRAPGWWHFTVGTEATADWFADTVRVYPLKHFSDMELLEVFPGMEGTVSAGLVPGKAYPGSALAVLGPCYDYWGIADALHAGQLPLTSIFVRGGRNQSFLGFPETAEALFQHRLLILCGVDAQSLSLKQKKMIVEFVARGGGLVLLGGHKAFERGGIHNSLLAELLPVAFAPESGGALAGGGRATELVKSSSHPLTASLALDAKPVAYWWHRATVRDGGQAILALANGEPAIVVGTFGKGRVACVLLTTHGASAPGRMPFWESAEWPLFLRDLCWWTSGAGHFGR